MDRLAHWNQVYASKASADVSWFQASPTLSLDLIQATGVPRTARILDVGGGTSRLVDCLLDAGYSRVGVLDIAKASLAEARYRIGSAAGQVEWFVGDVTGFQTPHSWEVWHDRAVFHFLTDAADRAAYRNVLLQCLRRVAVASKWYDMVRTRWGENWEKTSNWSRVAGKSIEHHLEPFSSSCTASSGGWGAEEATDTCRRLALKALELPARLVRERARTYERS
jgi:SAM-dependent methyltransferase